MLSEVTSAPIRGQCFINDLPVEILQNIFALGHAAEDDPPEEAEEEVVEEDDGDEEFEDIDEDEEDALDLREIGSMTSSDTPELPFSVIVSHVCTLWRTIVLGSPSLWTHLNFNEGRPFEKSKTWIKRSKDAALDIHLNLTVTKPMEVEDLEDLEDLEPELMYTQEDVETILDIICPEHLRWRCLSVHATKYAYIHALMSRLAGLPGAPMLKELEIVREEEDPIPNDDYTPFEPASLKEKFTLFGGHAPVLESISLWGVHIVWGPPFFSSSLHAIELAYHAHDIRPSFNEFAHMLHACNALESLVLCCSGPTGIPADWPPIDELRIHLPVLKTLSLAYLEPEYAGALLERLHIPKVVELDLDLPDGDYSAFAQQMATPVRYMGVTAKDSFLKQIQNIKISGFPCDIASVDMMFGQLTNVNTLHINFDYIDIFWFLRLSFPVDFSSASVLPAGQPNDIDSFEAIKAMIDAMHQASVRASQRTSSAGKAAQTLYLPKLATLMTTGITGNTMHEFVRIRKDYGVPLQKVLMSDSDEIDEEDEIWLKANLPGGFEIFEPSDSEDDDDDEEVDIDVVMMDDDED